VAPYWTTPGGGIEPGDASREAAPARELLEELGATAVVGRLLTSVSAAAEGGLSVQYFFVARLLDLDEARRSGAEHTDPTRGGYELERVRLDRLAGLALRPAVLADVILRNRTELLADVRRRGSGV
jgi:8-oxo-dGTP pyrophosphatase MutT (NUDIX family)